jgi:hypothetical protein
MSLEQKKFFESGADAQHKLIVSELRKTYTRLSENDEVDEASRMTILMAYNLAMKIAESSRLRGTALDEASSLFDEEAG